MNPALRSGHRPRVPQSRAHRHACSASPCRLPAIARDPRVFGQINNSDDPNQRMESKDVDLTKNSWGRFSRGKGTAELVRCGASCEGIDLFAEYGSGVVAWCFLALALGGFIKGALGVGTPLLTVPMMALVLPPQMAVAIMAIPVVVANLWQFAQSGRPREAVRRFWPAFVTSASRYPRWSTDRPLRRMPCSSGVAPGPLLSRRADSKT